MDESSDISNDFDISILEGYYGYESECMLEHWLIMDIIRQKGTAENVTEISFVDIKRDWPMLLLQGVLIAGAIISLNLFF